MLEREALEGDAFSSGSCGRRERLHGLPQRPKAERVKTGRAFCVAELL